MARVLVLDVNKNEVREANCNELKDFYRELQAELFDITRRKIGGKMFDIFVDDIGLFREDPVVSAFDKNTLEPMLVGNLIFANHDAAGNTTDLSMKDIVIICESIAKVKTPARPNGYLAVACEY